MKAVSTGVKDRGKTAVDLREPTTAFTKPGGKIK